MAIDDAGLNYNGLTGDEQATFEGLYGADAGAAQTEPKPGALAGWWHAAGAVPHALANVGLDVYGGTNTALHGAVDKLTGAHDFSNLEGLPEGYGAGTPFKAAPDTLRSKVDEAADETAQQVADLRSTVDQMYRPDPHTTGAAGNLLFGAVDPLVRIGVGSLLTRGAGGLEFAAGTQGYERTQELEAQGVDPGTAAASGAISAGTFEAMGAVGGEGGSLASRVLKSGAVNFAGGIANRGADSEVLKAAGYDKLAAQEQWNDAQTMLSDALIGVAFPLVHEGTNRLIDVAASRSEGRLADKIASNPDLFDRLHDGTGYVPAANVDAALTSLNARNAADVAPGILTDFTSQGLHYKALDAAIKQVANGDDVNVDPIVRGMNTVPRDPLSPSTSNAPWSQPLGLSDVGTIIDNRLASLDHIAQGVLPEDQVRGMVKDAGDLEDIIRSEYSARDSGVLRAPENVPTPDQMNFATQTLASIKQQLEQHRYAQNAAKQAETIRHKLDNIDDDQSLFNLVKGWFPDAQWKAAQAKVEGITEALAPAPEADPFRYAERDANGTITGYRSGEHFIPAFKALTDAQREVEARAAGQVLDDPAAAVAAYSALKGKDRESQGGNLINTDVARELFPDYNAGPEARSMNALAVHEPASWIAKRAWERALARPVREGKAPLVFFTGGGTGAGKSSGPSRIPALADRQASADVTFDGNLNGFKSATKKIDAALESKRKVHILYTFRDPVQAFQHGALPRAERYGRTVPIPVHVDTHVGAAETYLRLKKHYKGNSKVTIGAIFNDHEPGRESPVPQVLPDSAVAGRAALDRGRLASEVRDAFERERQAGRVSDRVYHGTLGTKPEEVRHAGAGGQGVSGLVRQSPENGAGRSEAGSSVRPEAQVAPNPAAGGVSASGAGEPLHAWTPVDDTVSVPYAGGVSADGKTIYLDKRMPDTVEVDGKTIDAKEAVVLHERTEWPLMHLAGPMDAAQIDALKARIGDAGTVPEKSIEKLRAGEPLTYAEAHQIATLTENHFVREKYGVDPEQYQRALKDAIAKARKEAPHAKDIPADLDEKPYTNSGDPQLLANKDAAGVESGIPSGESTRGADAKAGAGAAGEAGPTGPAERRGAAQDQEGRAGAREASAGDRELARAREAIARRPGLTLSEGVPAAEALRQADADVVEAHRQGAGIDAAIQCFLSFGSDFA